LTCLGLSLRQKKGKGRGSTFRHWSHGVKHGAKKRKSNPKKRKKEVTRRPIIELGFKRGKRWRGEGRRKVLTCGFFFLDKKAKGMGGAEDILEGVVSNDCLLGRKHRPKKNR